MQDPYKILGVSPSASQREIQKAYRVKAAKYHPKRGGDSWVFQQVQEAYKQITEAKASGSVSPVSALQKPPDSEFDFIDSKKGNGPGDVKSHRRRRQHRSILPHIFGTLLGGACAVVAAYYIVSWLKPDWRSGLANKPPVAESNPENLPLEKSTHSKTDPTHSTTKSSQNNPANAATRNSNKPSPSKQISKQKPTKNPGVLAPMSPTGNDGKQPASAEELTPEFVLPVGLAVPSPESTQSATDSFRIAYPNAFRKDLSMAQRYDVARQITRDLDGGKISDSIQMFLAFEKSIELLAETKYFDVLSKRLESFQKTFQVDASRYSSEVAKRLRELPLSETEAAQLAATIYKFSLKELRQFRFQNADEFLELATRIAKNRVALEKFLEGQAKEFRKFSGDFAKAKAELEILKQNPTAQVDLDTVLEFYALRLRDWNTAHKYCQTDNPSAFASLIQQDKKLSRAFDSETDALELADAYWKLADKEKKDRFLSDALFNRAAHWYSKVKLQFEDDDTLHKLRVDISESILARSNADILLLEDLYNNSVLGVQLDSGSLFRNVELTINGKNYVFRATADDRAVVGVWSAAPFAVNVNFATRGQSGGPQNYNMVFTQSGPDLVCQLFSANNLISQGFVFLDRPQDMEAVIPD